MTRRSLLVSLAAAPGLMAQSTKSPIPVRRLNQMTLTVSDLMRSLEFYQGLFGMPIQARQGSTVLLRLGPGPQFMALTESRDLKPSISQYGMSVENFDAGRVAKLLDDHGVKSRTKMRGETPELYLDDPNGIVIQLQDTSYCGGSGKLGNVCPRVEAAPRKGLLAVVDLSHFTLSVSNAQSSREFYQQTFGLPILAYQGPTAPALGVGSSRQFIMSAGGAGGSIGHGCFTMEGFNTEQVLKTLGDFGLKPRGDATGPAKPLVSYVSMRMENRGGAKEGTAELYFTDPDGILLQLQDVSYCGGGGHLGEVCLQPAP